MPKVNKQKNREKDARASEAEVKEQLSGFTQEQVTAEFKTAVAQWNGILLRNGGSRVLAICNDPESSGFLLQLSVAVQGAEICGFEIPSEAREILQGVSVNEMADVIKEENAAGSTIH